MFRRDGRGRLDLRRPRHPVRHDHQRLAHERRLSDRIYASNPCSEYMFLNDTACNLASLNLMKFVGEDGEFDVEAYRFACRVTITAQEILVDNASYPTPQIEENSHRFRPLGLGYANLGALLMSRGLAYDSRRGPAYAATLTAIMTGEAYRQSAVIARDHGGPFNDYALNEQPFLRVIGKHRDAAYAHPRRRGAAAAHRRGAADLGRGARAGHAARLPQRPGDRARADRLPGRRQHGDHRPRPRASAQPGQPGRRQVAGAGPQASAPTMGRATATKFFVNGAEPVVTVKTRRGYRIQGTTMHRIKVVDADGDWQWRRFTDVRAGDRVPLMLGGLIGEPREVPLPPLAEAYWTSDHTHLRAALHERGPGGAGRLLHGRRLAPRQGPPLLRRQQGHATSSTDWSTSGVDSSAWRPRSRRRQGYTEVAVPLGAPDAVVGGVRLCQACSRRPTIAARATRPTSRTPSCTRNDPAAYRAFVRGLFEADGNTNHGYASWSTVSEQFSHEVQTLLLALGFVTTRKIDAPTAGHLGSNPVHVLRLLNASDGRTLRARRSASSPSASGTSLQMAESPPGGSVRPGPRQPGDGGSPGAGERRPAQDDAAWRSPARAW